MTDYKEKIQLLQQLIDKQEDRIMELEKKLELYEETNTELIAKGNSTITPIPKFTGVSISTILHDREMAIIKMNNRNEA